MLRLWQASDSWLWPREGVLNKKVVGLRAWAGGAAGCPYVPLFLGQGHSSEESKCSQGSWGPGEGFLIPQICRSDSCWVSLRTTLQNVKFPGQILSWCSVWIIILCFLLWRGRNNEADQESHGEKFSKIEFTPILSCSWGNSWGKKSDMIWPKVAWLVNGEADLESGSSPSTWCFSPSSAYHFS